jgi:hypothetical protein
MSLAMLNQPLSLQFVMEILDLHLEPLLPLSPRDNLPIPILDDLLVLITVVLLLVHHVVSAVAPRYC